MRRSAVLLALFCAPLSLLAAGDTPMPKSPRAKTALKKYDRAVQKAQEAYDRSVKAAAKELTGELDAAIAQAMKAGSLDEAKRIEALMPEAGGAKKPAAKSRSEGIVGTWTVRYGNNNEREYRIAADGRLSMRDGPTAMLRKLEDAAGGFLLDFGDGKAERLRLLDGGAMLLVEHFNPKSDLAAGRFDTLGLGRRPAGPAAAE